MPSYTLVYFDARGRAEVTRLALSAAGQKFEDKRLNSEEWQKLKSDIPQGQLPILKVDGKVICQSNSMARFVAREHGLYGANNMEHTKVDVVLDTMEDLFKEFGKLFMEKDEEKKQVLLKELEDTTVPKFVKIYCDMLCENNGGKAWMVGSKLTVADIAVFSFFDSMPQFFGPGVAKSFLANDKLKTHSDRVAANPGIKAWLAKRPQSKG